MEVGSLLLPLISRLQLNFASSGLALSPTEPFHQHRLLTVLHQHVILSEKLLHLGAPVAPPVLRGKKGDGKE